MQSVRAPGGVPVLRIMLQVQMVTPYLVHVLSQSPGTVPMRQRGDRYVWSIFLRESAKINQFQPNVIASVLGGDQHTAHGEGVNYILLRAQHVERCSRRVWTF